MVRPRPLIAVVGTFMMGCAVLLFVGCAGGRSEAPQKEEQARSDRCEGTRTIKLQRYVVVTNDVPGCPKGGLLSGTDKSDHLDGKDSDDEIHGLGASDLIDGGLGSDVIYGGASYDALNGEEADDVLYGGPGNDLLGGDEGNDVIYGGDGDDEDLVGGPGEDVIYGGDGNDSLDALLDGGQRDKLYCREGRDEYLSHKNDYVDSSCEKKFKPGPIIP